MRRILHLIKLAVLYLKKKVPAYLLKMLNLIPCILPYLNIIK